MIRPREIGAFDRSGQAHAGFAGIEAASETPATREFNMGVLQT